MSIVADAADGADGVMGSADELKFWLVVRSSLQKRRVMPFGRQSQRNGKTDQNIITEGNTKHLYMLAKFDSQFVKLQKPILASCPRAPRALGRGSSAMTDLTSLLSSSSSHPSPETGSISSAPSQVKSATSAKRVQSRPAITHPNLTCAEPVTLKLDVGGLDHV
jgi:hypothetical protein